MSLLIHECYSCLYFIIIRQFDARFNNIACATKRRVRPTESNEKRVETSVWCYQIRHIKSPKWTKLLFYNVANVYSVFGNEVIIKWLSSSNMTIIGNCCLKSN